jgi:cytochrome c oxidase cbb3-type subunit III
MKIRGNAILSFISLTLVMSSVGCHRRIGPPNDQEELMRPENVVSFDRLYKQNCSACHGENGSGGPALDLANPNYQALVDDASLRRWITNGMPGTQMPAFGESAGGFLTPQQVKILVGGMRSRWAPADRNVTDMPPYSSNAVGTAEQGHEIFQANCYSCHQQGQQKITDTSYLALVSDQSLRTIVIAGRPDLGQPDYEQVQPGQPLTDEDVSDIVAYLHSLRSDTPGQPYPETSIKR